MTRNRLAPILEAKRAEIAALLPARTELRRQALLRNDFKSLARAIDRREDGRLGLIAEVKKASPSAGVIVDTFVPAEIARRYQAGGAEAVSVLTDTPFFQGHLDHLRAVREAIDLPILRKDFTLDEVQIYEAAAAGADAILLIVAALAPDELPRLHDTARACQLDVLVEVHTLAELDQALEINPEIIGINNRDLTTFAVDLATTELLVEQVPPGVLLVSESGIRNAEDSRRVREAGADAVLVGEALMRGGDDPGEIARRVRELQLRRAG